MSNTNTWFDLFNDTAGTEQDADRVYFYAVWTGSEESPPVNDVIFKIKNLRFVKRYPNESTIQVVAPIDETLIDDLLARNNGRLRIHKAVYIAGSSEPILGGVYADLNGREITYDLGARTGSLTINGGGVIPHGSSNSFIITKITERMTAESGRWIEVPFDGTEYNCGSLISEDNGQTYNSTISQVSISLSPERSKVELNVEAI